MLTVRVSPMEVQVGVLVYTFNDITVADGFEASATASASAVASREFMRRMCVAIRCRPVDCDHKVRNF